MDSLEGRSVAHYKVTGLLGSGGMGVVYEAEDTKLGRRVALKFLPAEMAENGPALERFQREARAASALNHPNICTVYAIEQHERQPFIVMELLDGESLGAAIGKGPLELGRLLDLGTQIADALESAHAKGIVHRDIKPANLFVNSRGQAKVLDFGLVKIEAMGWGGGGETATTEEQTLVRLQDLTVVGTTLGTIRYMSPEQARGEPTDARTDLFSLGTVLYQMATGVLPFQGETTAVVFDAILNHDPIPPTEVNPALPAQLGRILEKALEKDRKLRYQSATDLKTDLMRLRRDFDSGRRTAAGPESSRASTPAAGTEPSVAVLYLENLSGAKEDEYFRDGVTEDIITELSKIKGLKVFSRATVLASRDKPMTPFQIGKQLGAAYALTGSLRRAGDRLRINAQLVDTGTDFPVWSERYDREMKDVFDVQDEIAHNIAEALRVTLSPQEQQALAAKPTDDLQAYDLYLRGKGYARRQTRQDTEFALQMFQNAVTQDPGFALAYAAIANVCAQYHYNYERQATWIDRAKAASRRADELQPDLPDAQVARAWIRYTEGAYGDTISLVRQAIGNKSDCEGAYFLLGRALFAAGEFQAVADMAEEAIQASGEDYNVYVPIVNALGALGKNEAQRNTEQRFAEILESHLRQVPEDARARVLLAVAQARLGRAEDAMREANLAMVLRPDDTMVLYNVACIFSSLGRTDEAVGSLEKAWNAGYRDAVWTRQDPDLAPLHGHPDFERLFPESAAR